MPVRREPLITGEYYHVYNKAIDDWKIFSDDYLVHTFIKRIEYYRSEASQLKLSQLSILTSEQLESLYAEIINPKTFNSHIIAYCIMPNHYHFLLKQRVENGIQKMFTKAINSYTHSFNEVFDRKGPLFISRYQYRRIENSEDLIHTSRYIHLNPFSSMLVDSMQKLKTYPYSSYPVYVLGRKPSLKIFKNPVTVHFSNRKSYKGFVESNADYQIHLKNLKTDPGSVFI